MVKETKRCSVCGKNLPLEDYYTSSHYSWCKKCHIIRGSEFRRSPIGKLTEMKKDAKKRGIEFTLTIDDAERMWNFPCAYCGRKISILSLDRIDNSKSYNKDNVVACCRWCNYSKGTGSLSFFYRQCKMVVENMPESMKLLGDPDDGGIRYGHSYSKNT